MRTSGIVWDIDGVARTTGWGLIFNGRESGRIVSYSGKTSDTIMVKIYGDNPFAHPKEEAYRATVRGYGDQFGPAFEKSIWSERYAYTKKLSGGEHTACNMHEDCRKAFLPKKHKQWDPRWADMAVQCAKNDLGDWYRGFHSKEDVQRFLEWKGYTVLRVL